MPSNLIKNLLRQLPHSPGVYLMRNIREDILYVGKAKDLHNRVRAYFSSPGKLTPKTQQMVEKVNDFEYLVVSSEQEALILELNLIKRYRSPFNVLLKDDKSFPYLKIKIKEEWPRLHITRRLENDGSKYFGPFASIQSLKSTMDVIKRVFPLRSCKKPIKPSDNAKIIRPCLKYHLGYCLAPCTGKINREEYDAVLKQLISFLEGKHSLVTRDMEKKMVLASRNLDFERAARIRDQLKAIKDVNEGQSIAMKVKGEQDVIAFAADKDQACVQVFMIRNEKLLGRESFGMRGVYEEDPHHIMSSFIKQYYNATPNIPKIISLQYQVEDKEVLENWLSEKRNARVNIKVPKQGKNKLLVGLAAENASQGLEQFKIREIFLQNTLSQALAEIQKELGLPILPSRIEGYDISNIQGKHAVGSMVVFEDGMPKPRNYRRFKIKTVAGANDYAMLQEVLKRRFKRNEVKSPVAEPDFWSVPPDLILVDGGKGQLGAVRKVLKEEGLGGLMMASLAKENEEIFLPGYGHPVVLPRSSPGLKLLQRVRDEAHRFAIGYYQKVHKQRTFTSELDIIEGVGPKRKQALIRHFGSVRAIRMAKTEELTLVKGINHDLAIKIKETLS